MITSFSFSSSLFQFFSIKFSTDGQDPITSKLVGVISGVDGLEQFAYYKQDWEN